MIRTAGFLATVLAACSAIAGPVDVSSLAESLPDAGCEQPAGYQVSLRDGRVVAEPNPVGARVDGLPFKVRWQAYPDDVPGARLVHPVDDGFLVGYHGQELGGGIWWFSPTGASRKFVVKEPAVAFLQRGQEVLALTGAAFADRSSGKLLRMYRLPDGTWRWERVVELSRHPKAGLLEPDGSVLVLAETGILRVSASGEKSSLYAGAWRKLGVTSMVRAPDGTLYVGARSGVVELRAVEGGFAETFRGAVCP